MAPLASVLRASDPAEVTVDQLSSQLRWLVMERQALRERGAAPDELERNRLEIVRAQWQLTYAFVELHRPRGLDKAA